MLFKNYALALSLIPVLLTTSMGQSLKVVKDPSGNEIHINEDSSFIFKGKNHLMMYAIDPESDTRNVLMFDADTSFWLFNTGFPKGLTYSPFVRSSSQGLSEVWFRIGDVWYVTQGTSASTSIFYDNTNAGNPYQYIQIFNFYTVDLGIEVIEKLTGDTSVIIYDPMTHLSNPFQDENGNNIKVIKPAAERFGTNLTKDFIGAKFDPGTLSWGPVGLYQWISSTLNQLAEIGPRAYYNIGHVYKDYTVYQYLIDHVTASSTRVLEYNPGTHVFDDVSSSALPGYNVLDAFNLQSIYFDGGLGGMNSFNESIWKCRNIAAGNIRYYLRSTFRGDIEVMDLRNDENAFFIFDEGIEDTLYYYNYGEAQKGLIRYNIFNNSTKKDPTSIPFDSEFKLRGWKSKMYFGRYDPISGKIAAVYKDFNDNKYAFLESSTGEKIENPIDFTFFHDDVFVHSRTNEGIKLIYYDTATIVSTSEMQDAIISIEISPNPTSGIFTLNIEETRNSVPIFTDFTITTNSGNILGYGEIQSPKTEINLTGKSAGIYYLTLNREGKTLTTKKILLLN